MPIYGYGLYFTNANTEFAMTFSTIELGSSFNAVVRVQLNSEVTNSNYTRSYLLSNNQYLDDSDAVPTANSRWDVYYTKYRKYV